MAVKSGCGIADSIAAELWKQTHGIGGCINTDHNGAAWWCFLSGTGTRNVDTLSWCSELHTHRELFEHEIKQRKFIELRQKI